MTLTKSVLVLSVFAAGCAGGSTYSPSTPVTQGLRESGGAPTGAKVLVTVNGESITLGQVLALLVSRSGRQALDSLIVERLVSQEARRQGIVLTAADVEREIQREVALQGGWDNVREQLALAGWSEGQLREAARTQALIFKVLENQGKLKLTETELRELHQSLYGPRAVVQMIVISSLQEARTLLERLRKGESFELLARVFSKDESREAGGHLGAVARGELLPELDATIFSLEPGELSAIVSSPAGFHIFKLLDYTKPEPVSYEKVKLHLEAQLLDHKFTLGRDELLARLRAQAAVVPADPYQVLGEMLEY
jgi:parvulin-like peptidyl-prolyl isomerase